jgi:hypothetical protein
MMATADTATAYVARPERWDCDMGVMIHDD